MDPQMVARMLMAGGQQPPQQPQGNPFLLPASQQLQRLQQQPPTPPHPMMPPQQPQQGGPLPAQMMQPGQMGMNPMLGQAGAFGGQAIKPMGGI